MTPTVYLRQGDRMTSARKNDDSSRRSTVSNDRGNCNAWRHETELVDVEFRADGCRVEERSTTSGLRANWMFGSCRWMIGSRQSPRPRPLSLGEAGAPVRSNPGREGERVNVRARRLFDVQSTGPQVLQMNSWAMCRRPNPSC
jgi:hypothetical protein